MTGDFSTLSDILNNNVFKTDKLGRELDKCFAFKFWGKIVGKKFEKFSKPVSLKGSTLYVSVKNAAILQELSFYKKDIINKADPYFKSLNFIVSDIKFDYKNWSDAGEDTFYPDDWYPCYTPEELNSVVLSDKEVEELNSLALSIDSISFINPSVKEKYFNDIVNQMKARKLRNKS